MGMQMVRELCTYLITYSIKVNFRMQLLKAKVKWIFWIKTNITEASSIQVEPMEKAFIKTKSRNSHLKANGMTPNRWMEFLCFRIIQTFLKSKFMTWLQEKLISFTKMADSILEKFTNNCSSQKVKASSNFWMDPAIMDHGKMAKCTGMESTHGKMAPSMKEAI